eukprot:292795_1
MCTSQTSEKWMYVAACPLSVHFVDMRMPSGIDLNNYIIIDHDWISNKINCIYKYNINTDKWRKIDVCNDIPNITWFSAALDAKKQILFLSQKHCITQIELNSAGNITH